MYCTATRTAILRRALPTLAVLVPLILAAPAHCQDAIRAGFTRPGSPSGGPYKGKIIGALDDPATRRTFGGTVYFRVLEQTGTEGDSWSSGLSKFNSRFHPGIDFTGTSSPNLDTKAKYLYLYQVVNDRHTPAPIESVSVKLLVELKDITSWGYFGGVGFATPAGDDKAKGGIRPVSFSNVIGAAAAESYQTRAPAVAAPQPLQLVRVPTRRGEEQPKDKQQQVEVIWDALDPATDANFVMLLSASDFEKKPSFRAIWSGDNVLKRDGRSTVFGFTSDLPPTLERVRLRGLEVDPKGTPIRPAVLGGERGPNATGARLAAEGKAPTPKPAFAVAEEAPPAAAPPPSAPQAGGGLAAAPATGAAAPVLARPFGGIGSSIAGFPNGGGSGASGSGSGSGVTTAAASGQTQQTQQPSQSQTITFNPLLLNQQRQQQQQQQQQQRAQSQALALANGGPQQSQVPALAPIGSQQPPVAASALAAPQSSGDPAPASGGAQQSRGTASAPGSPQSWSRVRGADLAAARGRNGTSAHVVPEPAALVLAALALPFLFLLRPRKAAVALAVGGDCIRGRG